MKCNVVECCEQAVPRLVTVGCVHEHMRQLRWCESCYRDAQNDGLCCSLCWDYGTGTRQEHPLGHECDIRIIAVVDA